MIRNVVERETSRDRLGWQERLHGRVDEAFVNEGAARHGGKGTHLFDLLNYYRAFYGGRAPRATQFKPEYDLPGLEGRVSYVDVANDDSGKFVLLAHQPSPFLGVGEELTGRPVIDHPLLRNALSCVGEYQRCASAGRPEYALIDQHLTNGRGGDERIAARRAFYRLLLPLADADGRIVKLAYSFRRIALETAGEV
ncbi:MAG: hypothetical protein VW405_06990 [Rhodospirillaceae bacterium]